MANVRPNRNRIENRNRPFRTGGNAADRKAGRLASGLLVLMVGGLAQPAEPVKRKAAGAERPRYGEGRQLCVLANQELRESSGLACSRLQDGIFWSHNDSGDQPRLFAFNRKGENLGVFTVRGAAARDWEDMASFRRGARAFLVVGDIGDNKAERRECVVYVIAEPAVGATSGGRRPDAAVAQRIRFTYEDGPHNCESLAVDATNARVYLVSKVGGRECKVYGFPLPPEAKPGPQVARAVATLRIPTTSAMDISPDGLRAVVHTYGNAYEYRRGPKEAWAEGFSREPRVIKLPPRRQGESICYGRDGMTLYLTSEKLPTPLLEVPATAE